MLDTVQMHKGSRASFAQLKIYCLDPELVPLKLAPSWRPGVKAQDHQLQKLGFASEYIHTTNVVPYRDINLALWLYKYPTVLISIK